MKVAVLAVLAALVLTQIAGTPTVYRCYVAEGGWRTFNGKTHCELEGWRYVWREFTRR